MQTLIKTVVLATLVSFCAPISIAAAAEGTSGARSIANGKARTSAGSHKKAHKRASKRETKKPAKVTSHEL